VRDSTGHLRKMEDLLPDVADQLHNIQNQSVRNAIAAKIFGKEGAKLNGIFEKGAKGLAELRQEARAVGAVMSTDQIKEAEKFDDAMKSVGATVMMVRNVIGAALAPKLVELGQKLQTYILANKDKIVEWAATFADQLPGFIDTGIRAVSAFGAVLGKVIGFVSWFQETFGTTATVIAGFSLYFNGLTIAAAKFAFSIASFLPMLIKVGLVLAGLVTWPMVLAAALIAAAVAIWKYWGPITEKLGAWWDKLKNFAGFGAAGTMSTASTPALAPAMGFGKTVDAAARSSSTKNENHVLVDFQNLPTGTRVETQKADGGLDLSMGYGIGGTL
jgi:hypothetical protein